MSTMESYRYSILNFSKNNNYTYWSNTKDPPKSDQKKVFSIDRRDRHSLWKLHKSGVNLITLADMLESSDPASKDYALDIIKIHTKNLYRYLIKFETKIWDATGAVTECKLVLPDVILRRIKNIQKPN